MESARRKTQIKAGLFLWLIITLMACQLGPDYQRPELLGKKNWSSRSEAPIDPSEIIQMDWWTNFKDPYLDTLIREAISGNLDVKILLGRIQEAGATIKESKAGLFPSVDVSGSANFSKSVA